MAVSKVRSSEPVRNNSSSLLFAGNVSRPEIGSLDYGDTNMNVSYQGPVSGLVDKAFSSQEFSKQNSLTAMALTSSIGGSEVKILKSGSGLQQRQNTKSWRGYVQSDIEEIDLLSGTISYGVNAGRYIEASGINGDIGTLVDKAFQVPARLTYRLSSGPETKDY
jgi:hypothetical protein